MELMNDEIGSYLEHHGIKGMKWGVRNAETLRKYGLSKLSTVKAKLGSTLDVGGKIRKVSDSRKAKKAADKAKKAELRAQRKELGMKKSEYDKLRETTLKSHDPSVVAKGMRTLTDEELKVKIRRLQEEDKIAKMASSQQVAKAAVRKTRNEALNNNPLVKMGTSVLQGFLTDSVRTLGYDTIVKQGMQPVLEQKVKRLAYEAQTRANSKVAAKENRAFKTSNVKAKDAYKDSRQISKKTNFSDNANNLKLPKKASEVPRPQQVSSGKKRITGYKSMKLKNGRLSS